MDKDSIAAEYALGGLSNNIFASRYISYIPNKGQLITQIEAVLNEWNKVEKEQQKKRRDVLQTCENSCNLYIFMLLSHYNLKL